MNEEIKRKAFELQEKHYDNFHTNWYSALEHAILSTKNTISVLEELEQSMEGNNYALDDVQIIIAEQTAILTELESRI